MKMPSGKILILLAIIGLAAGVWYMTKQRPLSVDVARTEEKVSVKVFGLGTVEARVLSKIGFKVSNPIVELNADEGQSVRMGDVLARLDNTEQRARLAKAEAGQLSAEAAVKGAHSAILKSKAVLAMKTRTHERKQALYARRTVSAEAAEVATLELDTARAEHEIAVANLLASQAGLKTAKAQMALDRAMLDQHVLKAPFDAIVTARHLELGTVVKVGEPLFTLVDPATVWVLGHISESRSGLIEVGQPAAIRLRSRPHELYRGVVARIDIESDRVTEERRVYLTCKSCPEKFSLGEQAEVYITTAVLASALFVPENAVDNFDERQMVGTVWVVRDGNLKRQSVTFGHRTLDARLSIVKGLTEGAKVLTRLPKVLKEGRAVRIAPEKSS